MLNPSTPPFSGGSLDAVARAVSAATNASGTAVISPPVLLAALCDMQRFRFLVDGVPQPAAVVLADDLLFPAVAWVAHENARELLQADLGYRFEVDPSAILGVRASGPPVTAHIADLYRALFLQDACTALFCVRPDAAVEITTVAPQLQQQLFATFVQAPRGQQPRQEPVGAAEHIS